MFCSVNDPNDVPNESTNMRSRMNSFFQEVIFLINSISFIIKQGRKRPLDTPERKIERKDRVMMETHSDDGNTKK